jgi:hypothetical protein
MFKTGYQFLPLIILLFLSCKNEHGYTYAIKDFRKELQPELVKIVSQGIVMSHGKWLDGITTDKELIQLSQSEHPVLRACAIKQMLLRKSFNHFDVLMNHLDDTAIVNTDMGEFGYTFKSVSDEILYAARWKSQEEKSKTIDEVIARHNYLRSAYTILSRIEPQEKYYSFIKDMAIRGRGPNSAITIQDSDFGGALYALARFRKKEDTKIIKQMLLSNPSLISGRSLFLMQEFPDTTYLEVYEDFYSKNYYRSICWDSGSELAIDFINSIASYKTKRSANILDSLFNHKPFVFCLNETHTNYLREKLIYSIWNNKCEAYSKLRKQIEKQALEYEKNKIEISPIAPDELPEGGSEEKIRW